MKTLIGGFVAAALCLLASAWADTLKLKNDQTLSGKYAGGTPQTVAFESSTGMQIIDTSQISALSFGPAPSATAGVAPSVAAPPATLAIPAGTTLLVRMVDGASSRDAKGKRFTTTLETDVTVDGVVVAKAGTKVYGRVEQAQAARRFAGQSKLDLRLTELAIGGSFAPIVSGPYATAGSRTIGKTARGAAAGAAIGAIADGGDGAATGAAIGAVASGLRKGEEVVVQPGTLLEFQLQQPVQTSGNR